jgi:hypothetical protein
VFEVVLDARPVARTDDRHYVASGPPERVELVGDEGVALVDERLGPAGRELAELLHHRGHHVAVGQFLDVYLLVVGVADAHHRQTELPDHPELLEERHPGPEPLDGGLDVAVDQRHLAPDALGGLDGRLHVRAGFDVEPLAHARLYVRQHPVGEELEDGVALEQVRRFEVLGHLALHLSVSALVEFDRHDVGPFGLDGVADLLDAVGGDVGGPDDPDAPLAASGVQLG